MLYSRNEIVVNGELSDLLRFLVLPAVALLVLGGLTARRGKPEALGIAVGFLAAVVLFFLAYLGSPTTDPSCSDCSEVWGRWWEPGLVIFWLGLLLFAWVALVAGISVLSRGWSRRRSRSS
jgi:hypothetical protein